MTPRPTPVLETARLRLRPGGAADAEALHSAFADPELMRWWSNAPHVSIEQTRADLAQQAPEWRRWIVTLKDDDRAIGFVAAGEKRQGNVSEIGYLLRREYWGTGIATEAVTCVIDRLFVEGQRRVFADTDPDNAASRRLLERLGFRLEGVLRGEWETHIGVRDTALYGLLREDWHGAA
ncbi:GNAT family N-acetyltransferase [Sphingomonas psychrotolerans]|uniref:GNAT family N-acetyltransferase n=1 Tax=Sphingomonas psychrotolerans TaxID=1327635 RepID=A0ABU3N827_9SPHN|nr:GNAT family protein [Sphingomonas psychrotolerans]MDT8759500.1 GNAT family N-acetyltransferase [Sphingomonas psychrotolerans]